MSKASRWRRREARGRDSRFVKRIDHTRFGNPVILMTIRTDAILVQGVHFPEMRLFNTQKGDPEDAMILLRRKGRERRDAE